MVQATRRHKAVASRRWDHAGARRSCQFCKTTEKNPVTPAVPTAACSAMRPLSAKRWTTAAVRQVNMGPVKQTPTAPRVPTVFAERSRNLTSTDTSFAVAYIHAPPMTIAMQVKCACVMAWWRMGCPAHTALPRLAPLTLTAPVVSVASVPTSTRVREEPPRLLWAVGAPTMNAERSATAICKEEYALRLPPVGRVKAGERASRSPRPFAASKCRSVSPARHGQTVRRTA